MPYDISKTYVYAFHIAVLSVVFFIGVRGRKTPKALFGVLLGVSAIGILYHAFKLIDTLRNDDEYSGVATA